MLALLPLRKFDKPGHTPFLYKIRLKEYRWDEESKTSSYNIGALLSQKMCLILGINLYAYINILRATKGSREVGAIYHPFSASLHFARTIFIAYSNEMIKQ